MKGLAGNIPEVEQDPTEAGFVQDPYAFYSRIRAMGDFVYWRDYDMVMATTHAAVTQILKHPRMGRRVPEDRKAERPRGMGAFYALEEHSLLELEPPDHSRLRRLVTEGFSGGRVPHMAPIVSRIADGLIDAFPEGPFDLIEAFARPLAALAITEFLGVPSADARRLQDWSNDMVAMYQARRDETVEAKAEAASQEFTAYVGEAIAARRAAPRDDFLSLLVTAAGDGKLTDLELTSTAILLLNAGHEATVHTLGNAVNLLAGHPDRTLALQPDQIASTVEECLRFDPPLHLFTRHVYGKVRLPGLEVGPGDEIGCLLGSAGRDDAVWPDGARFDPLRPRRPHTAFGVGLHACVGAALARMELQIALPALFSRCPDLKIVEPPKVANLYHFHGFERLMVAVR